MVLLEGVVTYAGLGKIQCISDLISNQKVGKPLISIYFRRELKVHFCYQNVMAI